MARRESFEDARVTVVQLAAGKAHTLALTGSGGVYSWGRGLCGRSGVGVFQDELFPTRVVVDNNSDDEDDDGGSTGSSHTSAARGVADTTTTTLKGSKVTQIAAGAHHNLALTADGAVWSWGYNAHMDGQLGREETTFQLSPVTFVIRAPAEEVRRGAVLWLQGGAADERKQPKIVVVEAGGMMSSAVDKDGALWLWGAVPNPSEYLDTSVVSRTRSHHLVNVEKPERVRCLLGLRVYRVACGNEHIVAVAEGRENDVECYAWGSNQFGQLGLGDVRARLYPQVVKALATSAVGSIVDLACGGFHTAILAEKDVDQKSHENDHQSDTGRFEAVSKVSTCWTFGHGENGQLGHGVSSNSAHPAPVEGLSKEDGLRTVACGMFHTAVVTEAGDVWVWGMEKAHNTPARVFGESSASCHPTTGAKGIACGAAHTVTTANAGKDLWAWGRGQSGVLGLGHTSDSWFPCPVLWPPVHSAPWSDAGRLTPPAAETCSPGEVKKKFTRDEVEAMKMELAGVRRYAESLHAAVYGEVEVFSPLQADDPANKTSSQAEDSTDGALQKKKALHEWERRVEAASDADLARLDQFYRSMRARLKEVLFQRKMDEWCRRCRSAITHSSSHGAGASMETPPQRRELLSSYSTASTPSLDGL